jgi:hypothetical protein
MPMEVRESSVSSSDGTYELDVDDDGSEGS